MPEPRPGDAILRELIAKNAGDWERWARILADRLSEALERERVLREAPTRIELV